MDLVDDEHFVLAYLWRYAHLLDEGTDVFHRIVAGGIKLVDVHRTAFLESLARLTFATSLAVGTRRHTVDGLREDACTGRLAYATRPAEEVGMCKLLAPYGILQRRGDGSLTHHAVERHWTVLAC